MAFLAVSVIARRERALLGQCWKGPAGLFDFFALVCPILVSNRCKLYGYCFQLSAKYIDLYLSGLKLALTISLVVH